MAFSITELVLENGRSPFGDWFNKLDAKSATKVRVAVARLEQGNLSSVRWFRGIGEFRIDWGPGLRIYLALDGRQIILLLGGGTKKRQQKDIDLAIARWNDYNAHKADKD